jgi:molybdate transport system substrate-binding protein
MKRLCLATFVMSFGLLAGSAVSAGAAEVKVLTAHALATVLAKVGNEFERTTGHRLNVIDGFGPDFVRRINGGEDFDLLISLPATIDSLSSNGKISGASRTLLTRAGTGVEVKAGAPKPDISTVDAFKRAMLNAKSIGYLKIAGVPQLMDKLGLTDAIKAKVTIPDSDIVSELVAKGELEVGIVVTTQIMTTQGVELAGQLPEDIQIYIIFAGGVSATSKAPDAARALIDFIRGPVAAPVIRAQGMEPQ